MFQLLLRRTKASLCWLIITFSIASCGIPESGVPAAQVDTTPTALVTPAPSVSPLAEPSVEPSAEPTAEPTVDVNTTPLPPTPTMALQAVVDARFYWDWAQTEDWRREAQRTDLEEWLRSSYENKVIGADQDAIARATAAARPPAPRIDSPPPRRTDTPRATGIFEGHGGAYHDRDFAVQNTWQGYIGSQFWQVFAGAKGDDLRQGLLTMMWRDEYGSLVDGRVLETPTRSGWIRITSVNVPIVHLVAEDGSTLAFDLDKLEWVP